MEMMANLVEQHGGVVNDFTGDGLMASFGAPIVRTAEDDVERDACNAIRCAIAMDRALGDLNEQWAALGLPASRMRIGICSGEVVLGAYGSDEHMKYASVGPAVNTAARLESYDKATFFRRARPHPHPRLRVDVGARG